MEIKSQLKSIYCLVFIGVFVTGLTACSISNSAGSASDSAGSFAKSSESISDSSESSSDGDSKTETKADEDKYALEIQDYTASYARTHTGKMDGDAFKKAVSDIAGQHGIVDWEANPKTYRAIGKGLKRAGISGVLYEQYKHDLAGGDDGKMSDIHDGYRY